MESIPLNATDTMDHSQMNELRQDILKQVGEYVVSTGSANAYILSIDDNDSTDHGQKITSILEGHKFYFKANFTNTSAATLTIKNVGGTTIKAATDIRDALDVALTANAIMSGNLIQCWFDGTRFRVLNITLYKASQAQAEAEADDATYMTPLKVGQAIDKNAINSVALVKYDYTGGSYMGDDNTYMTVSNPSGTTFRYTYVSGTNPNISAANYPVGTVVVIAGGGTGALASGNRGTFAVTASGNNYFEVTNAIGVVEANKTLGNNSDGHIQRLAFPYTYTIPATLKQLKIRMVGAGEGGAYSSSGSSSQSANFSGAYLEKYYTRAQLLALWAGGTIPLLIGLKGTGGSDYLATTNGGYTIFGVTGLGAGTLKCQGGGEAAIPIATGGDLNCSGNRSAPANAGTYTHPMGAPSFFGGAVSTAENADTYGASGGSNSNSKAGDGYCGAILLEEIY